MDPVEDEQGNQPASARQKRVAILSSDKDESDPVLLARAKISTPFDSYGLSRGQDWSVRRQEF
jgi:hypothetical protein